MSLVRSRGARPACVAIALSLGLLCNAASAALLWKGSRPRLPGSAADPTAPDPERPASHHLMERASRVDP